MLSAKWLGHLNRMTQMAAGISVTPLTLQIGKNHGTTKSTSEIPHHQRRSVLNRLSAIDQCPFDCGLTSRLRHRAPLASDTGRSAIPPLPGAGWLGGWQTGCKYLFGISIDELAGI